MIADAGCRSQLNGVGAAKASRSYSVLRITAVSSQKAAETSVKALQIRGLSSVMWRDSADSTRLCSVSGNNCSHDLDHLLAGSMREVTSDLGGSHDRPDPHFRRQIRAAARRDATHLGSRQRLHLDGSPARRAWGLDPCARVRTFRSRQPRLARQTLRCAASGGRSDRRGSAEWRRGGGFCSAAGRASAAWAEDGGEEVLHAGQGPGLLACGEAVPARLCRRERPGEQP